MSQKNDEAAEFLHDFLRDGPKHSTECVSLGNSAIKTSYRIDWWRDILNHLGGSAFKKGNEWHWRLRPDNVEANTADIGERKEDSQVTHLSFADHPSLDAIKG
ncbi:hypothetical protein [Zavarzinella formosa]|uniref:hypothetical protein n=1 Tax=Zavarzinella formosa TaxID=360055 RepID=UPI00030E7680|nr:hypothetical protein [Zavarzinella formosa]